MKFVLLFCVLSITLSNVYSFHKKYNEGQSISYTERTVSHPANIYVELKQQDPVYSVPLKASEPVKQGHHFDIFSILKNKFAKYASYKPRLFQPAAAPVAVQYAEQPKFICSPVAYSAPQVVQEPAPVVYQEPKVKPAQVYTLPLQAQINGKTNIFSKIKSHFSGGELGASGATLKIIARDPYVHGTQLVDNQYVNSPSESIEGYARNSDPKVAVKVEERKSKPQ